MPYSRKPSATKTRVYDGSWPGQILREDGGGRRRSRFKQESVWGHPKINCKADGRQERVRNLKKAITDGVFFVLWRLLYCYVNRWRCMPSISLFESPNLAGLWKHGKYELVVHPPLLHTLRRGKPINIFVIHPTSCWQKSSWYLLSLFDWFIETKHQAK